jgi:hypothetical protein
MSATSPPTVLAEALRDRYAVELTSTAAAWPRFTSALPGRGRAARTNQRVRLATSQVG